MPVIKGPIVFKSGKPIPDVVAKQIKNIKIIEATNWQSEKYADIIKSEFKKTTKKTEKYTRSELFKLKRNEQIALLKRLKAKKIPRREKERVDLILKLMGGD